MEEEKLCLMALHAIPGIGDVLLKQLIAYHGSASEVFKKPKKKLEKIPSIGPHLAGIISKGKFLDKAELEFRKAEKENAEILFYTDKKFPTRLKTIIDAPTLLYFKGSGTYECPRTVGIVGTRQATAYGKKVVEQLVEELAQYQVAIISGLAYGIDIYAHRHALRSSIPTFAVMANGIDIIYPSLHNETALEMQQTGGLFTEYYMGTKPDAHLFPARNRIIAGLSDIIIVVEAASRGGALITAEIANSYNKDVFAVPGSMGQLFSVGCNNLIRDNKACIFTSVTDLAKNINWNNNHSATETSIHQDWSSLNDKEKIVMELFDKATVAMSIDELILKSAMSPGAVASTLLSLEFKNFVRALPGKQFQRQ